MTKELGRVDDTNREAVLESALTTRWLRPLFVSLTLLIGAQPVAGHNLTFTETLLLLRTDGTFQVDLTCDLDALALGVSQNTDDAELVQVLRSLPPDELADRIENLRDLFQRRARVRFNDEPVLFEVSFPEHGTPAADDAEIPTVLGVTARLTGQIPTGSSDVVFFASRAFPPIHLSVRDEASNISVRQVLQRGLSSEPFQLGGTVPLSRFLVASQYLALGFWHIVPEGPDHMLFVLGLFLLSVRLRPLVWQVTAFTVAHALTLVLATYGAFNLPPRLVEPLIALSIAYVAIENVFTPELKPWRPVVVFSFGLLHGLGFAGVLGELGLPAAERLTGLLTFNVGIELGQLAVILGGFLAIGWLRHRDWYRPRLAIPLSLLIATIGLFWAVERAFQS